MAKYKVIIYGMGKYWIENFADIKKTYEIVAVSDRKIQNKFMQDEILYIPPCFIRQYDCDYVLVCNKFQAMREELNELYGIALEKIIYYSDLLGKSNIACKSVNIDIDLMITIVIPTYNRRKELLRTLSMLEKQTDQNFNIIILDNCSDYDIYSSINEQNYKIRDRITIKRNSTNIGMFGNLANIFLQKNSGWIWTLSDDDLPNYFAVSNIRKAIVDNMDAGVILMSNRNVNIDGNNYIRVRTLNELAEIYEPFLKDGQELEYQGDFIYLSNKIYNMDIVRKYVDKAFQYCGTGVAQVIPILYMLIEKKDVFVIGRTSIVGYIYNDISWDMSSVAKGLSTVTYIDLDVDDSTRRIIYKLIMFNENHVKKNTVYNGKLEEILQNNIYKYMY